jgi:hypothetical protein
MIIGLYLYKPVNNLTHISIRALGSCADRFLRAEGAISPQPYDQGTPWCAQPNYLLAVQPAGVEARAGDAWREGAVRPY